MRVAREWVWRPRCLPIIYGRAVSGCTPSGRTRSTNSARNSPLFVIMASCPAPAIRTICFCGAVMPSTYSSGQLDRREVVIGALKNENRNGELPVGRSKVDLHHFTLHSRPEEMILACYNSG